MKKNKNDIWNKCTKCGKFIPYKDFENGSVQSLMIYPESEFTTETFETICVKCKIKEK
jgi:hypothetical protein